jgi:hypothetical protein
MLEGETRYAPVVDAHGRTAGVLSIEVIGHVLNAPAEDVPSGADAALADE